jgi:hypothetical protein
MDQLFHLRAIDEIGAQAIYEHDGRWFRIAFDGEWSPTKLQSRAAAIRCMLVAPYECSNKSFTDERSLIESVVTKCSNTMDMEDVPLSEVIHLFPAKLQKAWRTGQQRTQARKKWNDRQVSRWRTECQAWNFANRSQLLSRVYRLSVYDYESNYSDEIWRAIVSNLRRVSSRFSRTAQWADIEDAVSIASLSFIRQLRAEGNLHIVQVVKNEPWLRRYVWHALRWALSGMRRRSKKGGGATSLVEKSFPLIRAKADESPRSTDQLEIRDFVEQAIARSSIDPLELACLRASFGLFGYESKSVVEIAAEMKISPGRVYRCKNSALNKVANYLAQVGLGPHDF